MDNKHFSAQIRLETLKQLQHRTFGHIGGSMSIVEVLSVLYNDVMKIDPTNPKYEDRDYFVLSKGHAGPALYATLALKGYFPLEMLKTLNDNGTNLPSHADRNKTPGVDMTTGSLGQGLSAAVGIATGLKLQNKPNKVFAIVGDGELNEGQCYEALIFASKHKLDNLVVFVDDNKLQLDGPTKEVSDIGNLEDRFNSFAFDTRRIDGHNEQIIKDSIVDALSIKDKPSVIILDTIKGKGIKEFENLTENHHMRFSENDNKILDKYIALLEGDQHE
jgi:transketolase